MPASSPISRLTTFDKRGTGLSDRDVGYPTLEERSEDILTVLNAVGAEQVALLGVSEGGTIAAVFAAMFPERVKPLILYGTYARSKWAPDYPWGTKPEMADRFIAEMRRTGENLSTSTRRHRAPHPIRLQALGSPLICGSPQARRPRN